MRYRLYLYKTTAVAGDAPNICFINRVVLRNTVEEWKWNHADRGMLHFDAESVRQEILDRLSPDGNSLCRAEVRFSPENKMEYLSVVTSYENAKAVLNAVHSVAVERELVLYDGVMDRSFFPDDLYHKPYVTMRLRVRALNDLIFQTQKSLWHLRRLDVYNGAYTKSSSYAVTLKKDQIPFEERTLRFYELLKAHLSDGESLLTDSKCFTVSGKGYEITYCLEGYKKSADKIGYVEGGQVRTELMRRMPCEVAAKQLWGMGDRAISNVRDRMRFNDWVRRYPNPAERFAASIDLAKRLEKEKFDISIRSMGHSGSEVQFHVVEDDHHPNEPEKISVFALEEESAWYLLPIVETVYPYIGSSYYCRNHLPGEMMREILEKIRETRKLLINDTYDERIVQLAERFNLFVLARGAEDEEMIRNDSKRFVYEHRFDIAHLYDLFLTWAEDQFDCYDPDGMMFNIEGP